MGTIREQFRVAYQEILAAVVRDPRQTQYNWSIVSDEAVAIVVEKMIRGIDRGSCGSLKDNPALGRAAKAVGCKTLKELQAKIAEGEG